MFSLKVYSMTIFMNVVMPVVTQTDNFICLGACTRSCHNAQGWVVHDTKHPHTASANLSSPCPGRVNISSAIVNVIFDSDCLHLLCFLCAGWILFALVAPCIDKSGDSRVSTRHKLR